MGRNTTISAKELLKKGVPAVLIPGLLAAMVLGWSGSPLSVLKQWKQSSVVFPSLVTMKSVEDGDTFTLGTGQAVRLLGINAPDRGIKGFEEATTALTSMMAGKPIYLEYDRYQDDKFGRILAWAWIDCEDTPTFLPAGYMHLSGNSSRPGLMTNPEGCIKGTLVNEQIVQLGHAVPVSYSDRGPLKYEERIRKLLSAE